MNKLMIADLHFRETISLKKNNIQGGLDAALDADLDALLKADFQVVKDDKGVRAVRARVGAVSSDATAVALSKRGKASATARAIIV